MQSLLRMTAQMMLGNAPTDCLHLTGDMYDHQFCFISYIYVTLCVLTNARHA